MPNGKPRTEKQRKANHQKNYGSLKSFPKTRKGKNSK